MKKLYFTLLAVLFVFSANNNASAQPNSRDAKVRPANHSLNGNPSENGVTVKFVTRRYGGHRHSYGGRHYRGHRHGGRSYGGHGYSGNYRSHRFGHRYGGFRFNHYRPYYKPYGNYYQRPYRGYNNYRGKGYSGHNHYRRHDKGHNKRHGHGGRSSYGQHY